MSSPSDNTERSTGQLVNELSAQMSTLIRSELRLAQLELQQKGKRAGIGAGLFGAAGILALLGLATLIATAVLALALVLPAWLAALIVAVVVFIAAGVAGLAGKKEVTEATPLAPEAAMGNVKQDVETVKERAHR